MPFALAACAATHTSDVDTTRSPSPSATTAVTPRPDPHTADPGPAHLVAGDCFDADPKTLAGGVRRQQTISIVPCAKPHLAEVFGRFTYVGGPYPEGNQAKDIADLDCATLATGYDMDSWTVGPTADPVRSFLPGRAQSAAQQFLAGICYWAPRAAPTTGRLRHDKATLTPDQYAYLDAADRPESALADSPDVRGSGDPNAYRTWAAGVADTYQAEAQLLTSRHWTVPAQGPVNALVQRIGVVAQLWRTASQSPSESDIKRGTGALLAQTTVSQEKAARAALGLATSAQH